MKYPTSAMIVLCLFVLGYSTSCTVPAQPMRAFARVEETEVERFFQYFGRLRTLPREALRREYVQQTTAFAHHRSGENRLRLVLLLSLPATDFGNTAYALDLLQEYLKEPDPQYVQLREIAALLFACIHSSSQNHGYASLLTQLREELRGKESQLVAEQQLNKTLQAELEAHRSLTASLSKQLQDALSGRERYLMEQQQLSKKLQDEKKQVRRLQDQIERIKDIEKSLIERENTYNKGT